MEKITVLPGVVFDDSEVQKVSELTTQEVVNLLKRKIKFGDVGYVELVDVMGNDTTPASAARISYDGTSKVRSDTGLTKYLWRNGHTSPFEMVELKFHVVAPIFVFRQWHRHRTASLNEVSGRYTKLSPAFYFPVEKRVPAKYNKQGSVFTGQLTPQEQMDLFIEPYLYSYAAYLKTIGEENNIAKEEARIVLPVSIYSKMVWKIDLRNLFHFLKLRLHSHAQKEIRMYAVAIAYLIKKNFPELWDTFKTYTLDRREVNITDLKNVLAYQNEFDSVDTAETYVKKLMNIKGSEAREIAEWIINGTTGYEESIKLVYAVHDGHVPWYQQLGFLDTTAEV